MTTTAGDVTVNDKEDETKLRDSILESLSVPLEKHTNTGNLETPITITDDSHSNSEEKMEVEESTSNKKEEPDKTMEPAAKRARAEQTTDCDNTGGAPEKKDVEMQEAVEPTTTDKDHNDSSEKDAGSSADKPEDQHTHPDSTSTTVTTGTTTSSPDHHDRKDDESVSTSATNTKVRIGQNQRWRIMLEKLTAFSKEHGHCHLPSKYHDEKLKSWVDRQRSGYHKDHLNATRIAQLEAIGFEWGKPPARKGNTWITTKPWHERFEQLLEFKEWHGHCKVPTKYEEDPSLHRWVWTQQKHYEKGKLTKEQIKCLQSVGVSWITPEDDDNNNKRKRQEEQEEKADALVIPIIKNTWDQTFDELVQFKQEHGHTNVSKEQNEKLGTWIRQQRTFYRKKKLHPERIKRLDSIGFHWRTGPNFTTRTWKDQWNLLKKYKEEHKDTNVPADYPQDVALARWVRQQRRDKKNGTLGQDRINQLNELEFDWDGPGSTDGQNKAAAITAIMDQFASKRAAITTPTANDGAAAARNNNKPEIPVETQKQLAQAQMQAMAMQYQALTQQQCLATQQEAYQQQQEAYGGLTAHEQYALVQQQRAAAMGRPPFQPYVPTMPTELPTGWGYNSKGEAVWCGGAEAAVAPATVAATTTAPVVFTTTAATTVPTTPVVGPAVVPVTTTTAATNPVAPTTAATTTQVTTVDPAVRIKQLEEENAKLQEENLELRQAMLQLQRENTVLQTTVEETRQAYSKEKKSLEEQVQQHTGQLQEQGSLQKHQGEQIVQLTKQVEELQETQRELRELLRAKAETNEADGSSGDGKSPEEDSTYV